MDKTHNTGKIKMTKSGSKYATLAEAMKEKVDLLSLNTNNIIKKKVIEGSLKRIDEETAQKIEEIKATPIDTELIKSQAKSDYDTAISEIKRVTIQAKSNADAGVANAEAQVIQIKQRADFDKDIADENASKKEVNAKQKYDRVISSVGNSEVTLELEIKKATLAGETRKTEHKIKLESIDAELGAQNEKIACIDALYKDLKEISLKIGDINNSK
jgi:hypothetical protein